MLSKKNIFRRVGVSSAGIAVFFSLIFALCLIDGEAGPRKSPQPEKQSVAGSEASEKTDVSEKAEGTEKKPGEEPGTEKKTGDQPLTEYTADDFGPKVEEESYAWTIFKLLFVLGLMGGGFYYFFRFVTKRAGISILGQDVANVLSIVPVGQNKYLQVIDIAGRVLVLGVSDAGINLITEITSKDEIDRIRLLSSKSPEPARPVFNDYLVSIIAGIAGRISAFRKNEKRAGNRESFETDNLDYLARQKDRLKKINGSRDE